ncbi:MAG TPA: hypothetical protein VFK31_04215 [Rhodanobacteraceae bacterium]|nr:hypothetical protein [Rhodanobacteraceae bacterium]
MKRNIRNRLTGGLLAGTLLAASFGAMAQTTPTAAGTSIGNTATVNYTVGGVAQNAIGSSATGNSSGAGTPTTFIVDDMLSLTVEKVDTSIQSAAPGNAVTLTYKVTNNGNAAQGALLTLFDGTTANDPFSTTGTTEVAPTSPVIHVDDGDSAYNATNDTATSIYTIPVGGSVNVYVTFTLPANGNNNDISVVGLRAQVAAVGTSYTAGAGAYVQETPSATAWDPGTEQYVYAGKSNDAAGSGNADYDGYASAYNSALVTVTSDTGTGGGGTGSMVVTKTVSVVDDPTGASPARAIPGAHMMYTITVANGGASNATNVSVEDDINTEVAAGYITYKTGTLTATANGTTVSPCTEAADTDGCTWDASNNKVTVGNLSVDAGKTAVVTFEVTIK